METRLIKIGNSRGIRIPEALLRAAGLGTRLRLRVVDSGLLVESVDDPRAGWAHEARELGMSPDAGLLDEPVATAFDDSEWEW